MRTTLACQWCRGAKIKCHHNGSAPCRACAFNSGRECVLSRPKHRSKRLQSASTVRTDSSHWGSESTIPDERHGEGIGSFSSDTVPANGQLKRSNIGSTVPSEGQPTQKDKSPPIISIRSLHSQTNPLIGLDKKTLERSFHIFVHQFPEFGFFHQPTFLESLDKNQIPDLLLCGILAISARFLPELFSGHANAWEASECFANHVRQNIMSHVIGAINIGAVQALLLLSLHDWGNGNGSHAWTYNGMATRMIHGIYAQVKDKARTSPSVSNNIRTEEACRTVWACFLLDTMIGCGKCQSSRFTMSTSEVPLPLGEDQFAFGDRGPSEQNFLRTLDPEGDDYQPMEKQVLESIGGDEILGLTIRGFYIWSTISAWVSASGRRRETPSSRSPPWQNSSFWSRSMAALEDWRASQIPQLVYSPANMNLQVYISRNEGERFAMVNLLYYLSLIFLHREYVPFIPHSIIRPCGPTDPPLLVQEAPAGWWDHSARALFSAASNIIQILQQLDQRNVQFQTPFTCFCVFSAASTLLYANAWPYMAPGLDYQLSMKLYSWGSTWLHQASSVWKVSEAWYSTLVFLTQLYSRVRSDPVQFPGVSRDAFLALEENIQRLAGSEPPDSPGLPTANILLTLQRQTQKVSRPTNNQDAKEGLQSIDSVQNTIEPATQEARQGSLSELSLPWNANPEFNADYEFLASILSDPSADWIYPT